MTMSFGVLTPFESIRRRTIRAPVNPMDKATVVSIFPKKIDEVKHTIQPGRFIIPPGTYDKPAVLVVGPSSWWREIDEEQPLLEIPTSAIQIADSIVRDWANGLIESNMTDCMPGIFYFPGSADVKEVKEKHKAELDKAAQNQKNWYTALVRIADVLWAQSLQNPLSISEDMRLAAQELQLKEKPWLRDFSTIEMVNCKFCGTMLKPGYPVCVTCHHVVDEVAYKAMNPVIAKEK